MNSKSANTIKLIARELLLCEEGERIPTTPYFSEKLSVGYGTIDKVLTALGERGVINLQSRGQMGTLLLKRDFIELWKLAEYGAVIGLLPLPNINEYAGLATGFTEFFTQSDVSFSLNFKNGAKERVKTILDERCDFIVVSSSAANEAIAENDSLSVIEKLSPGTYYSGIYVLYRKGIEKDIREWNIGVDYTSYDHMAFSKGEFPENPKKSVYYINMPYMIADGIIDAAIIHNQSLIPAELVDQISIKPFEKLDESGTFRKDSSAIILGREDKPEIATLFREIGNISIIEKTQEDIISRRKVPSY